jgi:hypothetical protein
VSPPEKHPFIASTWTSESLPRAPCAVSVEHSRHELKQRDKSRSSFFAVFNARATSSRRSEGVSSRALSLLLESSASLFCPYEEPRTLPRAVDLDLTPKGRVGTSDAPQSPFGSHLPTIIAPWLRRAAWAVSSLPETSAETLDDPWLVTRLRRARPQAARPPPSLRRAKELGRRETAPRLRRNRCHPLAPRHTPRGTTPHLGAPPGSSRDPSSDPSAPSRSEDRSGASRYLGDPKTTATPREPASEPQDPIATTLHAPASRGTTRRWRHMRRDPAGCSAGASLPTTTSKGHRESSPLASQPSELVNAGHSPRSVPPKRPDTQLMPSSKLRGNAFDSSAAPSVGSEEPRDRAGCYHHAPCATHWFTWTFASRPRRDGLRALATKPVT